MKSALDFYSGIGGWTLGMKLSNIQNVASFEWWEEANNTHNKNFGTNHKEIDIRKIDVKNDLNFKEKIDFIVGSPPCTQFSFANRGGNGDLKDGLVDIRKFLEIVDYIKPQYWAMENVPRVAKILEKELTKSLKGFKHLVKVIKIVDSSDYGVPQSRKRMIAGNFPDELFDSYKMGIKKKTLGNVIDALEKSIIVDPNYGYRMNRNDVSELENEADLTIEELKINKNSKIYHPIYNKMSFPENFNKPSRTITATCTRVSRESIILPSANGFRRLNTRERAVIQGFPISYQFYGKTLNSKFKMIGNAVPPILTYYIFQSMLGTPLSELKGPEYSTYQHQRPKEPIFKSKLDLPVRKFPQTRKFQLAIPYLRFGSGIRFELSNSFNKNKVSWSFKFFYGNSKSIKELKLNQELADQLHLVVSKEARDNIDSKVGEVLVKYKRFSPQKLQSIWTSSTESYNVIEFTDFVGDKVLDLLNSEELQEIAHIPMPDLFPPFNKSLNKEVLKIVVGCLFLTKLNTEIILNENIKILQPS